MSDFYTRKRADVLAKLKDKGFPLTIKYQDNDSFNAVTGELTEGTDKKVDTYGLYLETKNKRQNPLDASKDTLLKEAARRVMVAAEGVTIVPEIDDLLEIANIDYVIKEVEPLNPGGIDLYWEVTVVS